jgi:hypothetical protein
MNAAMCIKQLPLRGGTSLLAVHGATLFDDNGAWLPQHSVLAQ